MMNDDAAVRARLAPQTSVGLLHCADDVVVPAEHHQHHADRWTEARCLLLPTGGHQFEGRARQIADALRRSRVPSAGDD